MSATGLLIFLLVGAIAGWLAGLDPTDNLRRANIAGSLAVRRRGPMEGASSVKEIEALLDRYR